MIEGRSLHSRYNPQGEAERYVNSLSIRGDVRYIILIEPGRGYCIPPLRRRFPGAKIIALHLSDSFAPSPGEALAGEGPDARWSPGGGIPVQRFLEGELPETGAATVKIVEWRPALKIFGESYLRLLGECADFIKRTDAGERTLRQFGGRWFKNCFKNLALIRKTACFSPISAPVVVAGAGPSLEDALPLIKERRRGIFLLAAASSAMALGAAGISPDLLISTDGGNWARLHLYECFRRPGGGTIPALAAGVNAALPSQCAALPLLFISDGSLWQALVLRGLGIPFLSLPQRGTVSAAALDLAFSLGRGKVFITGLDLSRRDIRTHARPYAFDRIWEEEAVRFNPRYHRHFVRGGETDSGGSQTIYAAWFGQHLDSWPKRLFSLGGNHPVFRGLEAENPEELLREPGVKPPPREIPLDLPGDPRLRGQEILLGALKGSPWQGRLLEELGPLLLPPGETPSLEGLERAILFRGGHG